MNNQIDKHYNSNDLKVRIHGISDGKHTVELKTNVENISHIFPEFFGTVTVVCELTKLNNRFHIKGLAKCNAKLICDISLEEFVEEIFAEISVDFIANAMIYNLKRNANSSENNQEFADKELTVSEDDEYFDLADEIKDSLIVALPMRRVSPNYRDKNFAEYFPQYASNSNKVNENDTDSRWEILKNISFDG